MINAGKWIIVSELLLHARRNLFGVFLKEATKEISA